MFGATTAERGKCSRGALRVRVRVRLGISARRARGGGSGYAHSTPWRKSAMAPRTCRSQRVSRPRPGLPSRNLVRWNRENNTQHAGLRAPSIDHRSRRDRARLLRRMRDETTELAISVARAWVRCAGFMIPVVPKDAQRLSPAAVGRKSGSVDSPHAGKRVDRSEFPGLSRISTERKPLATQNSIETGAARTCQSYPRAGYTQNRTSG